MLSECHICDRKILKYFLKTIFYGDLSNKIKGTELLDYLGINDLYDEDN